MQFIADLFKKVNVLYSSLQGPSENTITATSTLTSFDEKLSLWKSKVSEENFDAFFTVSKSPLKKRIIPEILNTLSDFQFSLRNYFPEFGANDYEWVINPFGKIMTQLIYLPKKRSSSLSYKTTVFIGPVFPKKI